MKDLSSAFYTVAHTRDISAIQNFLAKSDSRQKTALMHILIQGLIDKSSTKVFTILLDIGVGFKLKSLTHRTLLHLAARQNNTTAIKLLLAKGSTVNPKDLEDYTPLHLAAWSNNKESVDLLLAHPEIELDRKTRYGFSALHLAAHHGHVEVLQSLLAKGADPTIVNLNGNTPLDYAAWEGHTACVEALIKEVGVNANAEDKLSNTSLSLASEERHIATAKVLLKNGADATQKKAEPRLLAWFLETDDIAFKTLLLVAGLNIQSDMINQMTDKSVKAVMYRTLENIQKALQYRLQIKLKPEMCANILSALPYGIEVVEKMHCLKSIMKSRFLDSFISPQVDLKGYIQKYLETTLIGSTKLKHTKRSAQDIFSFFKESSLIAKKSLWTLKQFNRLPLEIMLQIIESILDMEGVELLAKDAHIDLKTAELVYFGVLQDPTWIAFHQERFLEDWQQVEPSVVEAKHKF